MHLFRKFVLKLATSEPNKLSTIDEIFHVYLFVVEGREGVKWELGFEKNYFLGNGIRTPPPLHDPRCKMN